MYENRKTLFLSVCLSGAQINATLNVFFRSRHQQNLKKPTKDPPVVYTVPPAVQSIAVFPDYHRV